MWEAWRVPAPPAPGGGPQGRGLRAPQLLAGAQPCGPHLQTVLVSREGSAPGGRSLRPGRLAGWAQGPQPAFSCRTPARAPLMLLVGLPPSQGLVSTVCAEPEPEPGWNPQLCPRIHRPRGRAHHPSNQAPAALNLVPLCLCVTHPLCLRPPLGRLLLEPRGSTRPGSSSTLSSQGGR